MKWIIAGTRWLEDKDIVKDVLNNYRALLGTPDEVVTGGATGIDNIGKEWAIENKILSKEFKADWKNHGKSAGPIRNKQVAKYIKDTDKNPILILIWNGSSKGSANMKRVAEELGITVYEKIIR